MPSVADRVRELAMHGPVRADDLLAAGIPRANLQRLAEQGVLERVARGLYRIAGAATTELSPLADIARRNPNAVFGLLTALQFHELTAEVPHEVWILLHRRARPPQLEHVRLHIAYASGKALSFGVEEHLVDGVAVRITAPAKTVADCFRYRSHVGLDVALEALRDFLRRGRARSHGGDKSRSQLPTANHHDMIGEKKRFSVDALVEAANADGVYSVIRPYLEALI